MSRTAQLGLALIAIGVVLALLSGLSDVIGVGGDQADFGWAQIAGLAVGTALLGAGIATAWLDARGAKGGTPPPEREPIVERERHFD